MTAQRHDMLLLEGTTYAIVALENTWPFRPSDYGLTPEPFASSCCRGYCATYAVHEQRLVLDALAIAGRESQAPTWRGTPCAKARFGAKCREWTVEDIELPIPYTGRLVLGASFLAEYYVHMGFQSPHAFNTVLELQFVHGVMGYQRDCSDRMVEARRRLADRIRPLPLLADEFEDVHPFVRKAFSLEYADKWPQ